MQISKTLKIRTLRRIAGFRPARQRVRQLAILLSAVSSHGAYAATDASVEERPALVQTPWAESVRKALSERMHHAVDAGRHAINWSEHGVASWYGRGFLGHRTSDGSTFSSQGMTAAHPTLPMGSKVLVTSEDTGRSVVVTINDRGPFNSRIIDLSHAAAAKIGMLSAGTAHVKIAALPPATDAEQAPMEVAEAEPADTNEQAVAAAEPVHATVHRVATRRQNVTTARHHRIHG